MLSRTSFQLIFPIASITVLIAGCLELGTTAPDDSSASSTGSSMSSNGSPSSSSSSSGSSSSSSGSSSSSSSTTSSSAGPSMPMVVAKSNLGMTLQNDSGAVVCGNDPQVLPDGMNGTALECTHVTMTSGRFIHGLEVDLVDNVTYTFSFYFRNGNFDTPFGQDPSTVGITMISPNGGGGGALSTFDAFPNQWYRQRYPFKATATGTYQLGFTHSLNRPPGGGYWLYGFQVEVGYEVSNYVPE